jgi:hypothetical protein
MWRAFILLIFLALIPTDSIATGLTGAWSDSGVGETGFSLVVRVATGADGSIVTVGEWGDGPATLFGEPYQFVDAEFHWFLSKHAPDGTLQWVHEIPASEANGLAVDGDGSIAMCGRVNDPGGDRRGYVRKYNPNGVLLWESILDGCCDKIGVDVAFTSDGGVAAVGFWDYGLIYIDTVEVSVAEPVVAATLRYAPDGTLLWYDTQGTVPQSVLVGPGDEITAHAPLSEFRHFDAAGNIEWEENFWSPTGFAAFSRSVSGAGGDVFAAGFLDGSLVIDGIVLEENVGGRVLVFVRLGSDGVLQWASPMDGDGDIFDVAADAQGNSFALAQALDELTFAGTIIPYGEFFLVIHDPTGTPILACQLDKGTGISAFTTMTHSSFDGSLVVGGRTDGPETTAGILIDPGADAKHALLVDIASPIPTGASLPRTPAASLQAFPNPFNPQVTIRYTVPRAGDVRLDIHSVDGAHVRSLVHGYRTAGAEATVWDGRNEQGRAVSSGVYVAVLRTGASHVVQKVTLIK